MLSNPRFREKVKNVEYFSPELRQELKRERERNVQNAADPSLRYTVRVKYALHVESFYGQKIHTEFLQVVPCQRFLVVGQANFFEHIANCGGMPTLHTTHASPTKHLQMTNFGVRQCSPTLYLSHNILN